MFGKGDITQDNLTMIIKFYIYQVRKNNKSFYQSEFLNEIYIRCCTDNVAMSQEKFNTKWAFIDTDKIKQMLLYFTS